MDFLPPGHLFECHRLFMNKNSCCQRAASVSCSNILAALTTHLAQITLLLFFSRQLSRASEKKPLLLSRDIALPETDAKGWWLGPQRGWERGALLFCFWQRRTLRHRFLFSLLTTAHTLKPGRGFFVVDHACELWCWQAVVCTPGMCVFWERHAQKHTSAWTSAKIFVSLLGGGTPERKLSSPHDHRMKKSINKLYQKQSLVVFVVIRFIKLYWFENLKTLAFELNLKMF